MLQLSYEEKLELMRQLNWDSLDSCEDMLAVVEGRLEQSGAFDRDRLFVRSLERLPWYYFISLWGIDEAKKLYSPENASRIWPKERRRSFDFAFSILQGNPIPPTRWGTERYKSQRNRFFSNRGNCS